MTCGTEYKKKDAPWLFRADAKRKVILDPEDHSKILAESKDWRFIVDDPMVAQFLHDNGYEEWTEITLDDEFELQDGTKIPLSSLPAEMAKELIGKPRKLLISGKDALLSMFTSDPDKEPKSDKPPPEDPKGEFVCENCQRDFDSLPALNGHKGHCKPETPEDPNEPEE